MFNFLFKMLTNNRTQIPLIFITFDYNKYKNNEIKNCTYRLHPILKEDQEIQEKTKELIDLIRSKYNMEDM